jgi:hypothetical protein
MTLADAARLLGCDRSYLGRMAKYLKDDGLRGYVRAGVPSWVVIRASELLGATSVRDQALAAIHQRHLNGAQAMTYLDEVATQTRALRTPTAPRGALPLTGAALAGGSGASNGAYTLLPDAGAPAAPPPPVAVGMVDARPYADRWRRVV